MKNLPLSPLELAIVKAKAQNQIKARKPSGVCLNFSELSQKEQTAFAAPIINAAPFVLKGIDRELAKDFVSDAFAKYWANPSAYNSERSNFRTFIYNSAKNLAIDFHRSKSEKTSRFATVKINETDKDGENITHSLEKFLADKSADFIAENDKGDKLKSFYVKLASLPELTQKMLTLRLQDVKEKDVAEMLNVPLGTVKGTVNRAFHKMGLESILANKKAIALQNKLDKGTVKESTFMSAKEIARITAELN